MARSFSLYETVARRRSATLLSEFGLGHVREYAPFSLILSALHLILRAKSQVVSQKVCKAECLFELQIYLFFFALLPINNKDRPRKN